MIGSRPRAVMARIAAAASVRVPRGRIDLGRPDDVDQMMRNAALLGRRHLVGADVDAAVHGGRIARDDFAAEAPRDRQAERALAGGRGADDRDGELALLRRSRDPDAFVVVERDGEERAVVRILRRQRAASDWRASAS